MTDPFPPLLPRVPHGGPGAEPFTGLDFSVNTNPYGPNPLLVQAVRDADHAHYPDPTYRAVREKLAAWHGVEPDQIALSVGASDLLHRLARVYLSPERPLLSLQEPFGELARAAALQRAETHLVSTVPASMPPQTALVYLGHPHNPSGQALNTMQLHALTETCAQANALLIVDEAYTPFTTLSAPPRHPHVVRVLSPGKAHGLVGVRPAYVIANAEVVERLENLAPAWHVPAGTAAALAHLPNGASFLAETLRRVQQHAQELALNLAPLGRVEHHGTPFMTLRVGDAALVAAQLLERGIKVRDCASYGQPNLIRVSTRLPGENATLVRTLTDLLPRSGGRHG